MEDFPSVSGAGPSRPVIGLNSVQISADLVREVVQYGGRDIAYGARKTSCIPIVFKLRYQGEVIAGGFGFEELYLLEAQAPMGS